MGCKIQRLRDLQFVPCQDLKPIKVPLQMVWLPVRSVLTTEIRQLLSNLTNSLVEMQVFALDDQHPTRIRTPR